MNKQHSIAALVATTLVVAACSSNDRDPPVPPPTNQAPQISAVTSQAADQDTAIPVEFAVQDDGTPANLLKVMAAADGTGLFPADGLTLTGTGTTRTLTLTPLEAATGSANILITVTDEQGVAANRSFVVTVNARGASFRDTTLSAFSKAETAEATPLNGFTFAQDANDPATFDALIGAE
jgi:hypothetical protein